MPLLWSSVYYNHLILSVPDKRNLCKKLKNINEELKVIAISNFDEVSFVKRMLNNGANGYLLKNTDKTEFVEAIETVYNGENYFSKDVKKIISDSIFNAKEAKENNVKLRDREKEVLRLISKEKSTKEIAELLFISVNTVETHRKNLMRKIGTKNMVGLVKYAIQQDIT